MMTKMSACSTYRMAVSISGTDSPNHTMNGAELRTVARLVAQLYFIFLRRQFLTKMRIIRVAAGTDLCQLAMQMNHAFAPGTLVQIINILRNDRLH